MIDWLPRIAALLAILALIPLAWWHQRRSEQQRRERAENIKAAVNWQPKERV